MARAYTHTRTLTLTYFAHTLPIFPSAQLVSLKVL